MTSTPFATCAGRPGVGLAELAIALAAEFRPVDRTGVAQDLAALALELHGADRLPVARQLDALAGLMRGFRPTVDPLSRTPLMLDAVLQDRAGDPLVLAVMATDLGRRAGLDVAVAGAGHELVVAHRRWTRPLALAVDAPGARVARLADHALSWRCPHQVVRMLLTELVDRSRRGGDVSAAIDAAQLALALPLERRARVAMRAELAGLRATLN
jgi:hypothetical protein